MTRRTFVGQCCAAVGATSLLSALAQLRLMGAAAQPAASVAGDYKALVCLFLHGGNDANNLIIPTDPAGYASYTAARAKLALPRSELLGIKPAVSDGRSWALHPAVPEVQGLFSAGELAVLANVGTLAAPTSKAQFLSQSVPLPWQLFSHYDQQVQWQNSVPDQACKTGWGGRLADLTQAFNENNAISMSISLNGRNLFQTGNAVTQYAVDPAGVVKLQETTDAAGSIRLQALKQMLSEDDARLFETAFGNVTSHAIDVSEHLAATLAAAPGLTTVFPDHALGRQLQMIARLIRVAPQLGLRRQVFFAQVSGFDLHDKQVDAPNSVTGPHAKVLAEVSTGMHAFRAALLELGVFDRVTTFTASDFGRTYTTNGDGSDHGWGSHHLIMGGAVRGGTFYGRMPDLTVGGPDDTGRGRWIPTTSVDEYAATLARWFGVSDADLPLVLPNIGRFARRDLGFLV